MLGISLGITFEAVVGVCYDKVGHHKVQCVPQVTTMGYTFREIYQCGLVNYLKIAISHILAMSVSFAIISFVMWITIFGKCN